MPERKAKGKQMFMHGFISKFICYTYIHETKEWQKYLKSPIMHSSIPTIRANNIASSVYNSLDGSAMPLSTLETKRETNATGPTASWREDPNMAYTNMGTKPESSLPRQ